MKTIFLGDTHGRSFWKLIVNTEKPDRVVFIGDYFDSFDIKTEEQCNNFLDIIAYKKSNISEVIMLIGNHDLHYITGDTGTSGYQRMGKFQIEPIIKDNLEHLQICYQIGEIVCTHAGVSSKFMDETFGKDEWKDTTLQEDLNELWKYKPDAFRFYGTDPYGDNTYQTPLWIRPASLMRVNRHTLRTKIIQIVGHTSVSSIDKGKATGNRYWFIDALGTCQEYLIFENDEFKVGKI